MSVLSQFASTLPRIRRSTRATNIILGPADRGTFIEVTSGTFTQTFTAAATLGDGWYCYYHNRSSGTITLDPNASETIDAASTLTLLTGEFRLIQCNGTGFNSVLKPEVPAQLTHSGKFLTTDGTNLSWGTILASPAFTGMPTAPTAAKGTNTTQLATTAFVQQAKTAFQAF